MSVNIKYKNNSIAELTDTGTKTLKTAGKYCEADIIVENTKDSEAIEWHQCPEAVRNYLAAVTYDPSDYSTSQIANYAPATAVVSNYKPIGVTAGSETYYNEKPNVKTPFANSSKAGTLKPLDFLRWIRTSAGTTAWNVRDLGGWACDGGTVKYGLLIRGGRISASDREVLVGQLGVQHEIDLRGKEDSDVATESPLGGDVWFTIADKAASYALTPVATWQLYLRCVIDAVTHREPVYFHCTTGADSTGTLACVLEGLLGLSQSDIDKDYELSTFYSGSGSDTTARRRNEADWKGLINAINAVSGDTFRDKCVHFAVGTCGMSMADINAFRAAMIDGTPETLHWYQTITKNLTNCASSNTATSIAEGASYTTTLSPTGTFKKLGAITVTMGGVDISASAVSGSTITIAKVTGDIVITCEAVITNIIDTIGISANTYLNTGSGNNYTLSGYAAIGANNDAASLIHLAAGDTLRIKGVSLPASNDGYSAIVKYDASGTFISAAYLYNERIWNKLTFKNSGDNVVITCSDERYFRISLICTDASAVVATVNEEIT